MDVSKYRKQYGEELERAGAKRTSFRSLSKRPRARGRGIGAAGAGLAAAGGDEDDLSAARQILEDQKAGLPLRLAAAQVVGGGVRDEPDLIEGVLRVLRDQAEPAELRKEALRILQQSSFLVAIFAPQRAAYLKTLRALVDDPDRELRRRVIGILAREKDEYVQRRLLEGLDTPSRALVPPAKAIQFLGYDIHAEYFPRLKRIVERPPSAAAKREAIRLLGADPSAKGLLVGLVNDKAESSDVRRTSAAALQGLSPDDFATAARRIAVDDDDDDELRAMSISALASFPKRSSDSADGAFAKRVAEVQSRSKAGSVRRAARAFLAKAKPAE